MTSKFDEKVICGDEYIALREQDTGESVESGGIVLADSAFENSKLGFYVVESVGKEGKEKYGLTEGDYVFADRLASFYHSSPVCLMKCENIIVKTDKTRTKYIPLKNTVFVEEDKKEMKASENSGFYVETDPKILRLGTIIDMDIDTEEYPDYPFSVGDHVMLVRGGDFVKFGQKEIYIFKPEKIICKIVE